MKIRNHNQLIFCCLLTLLSMDSLGQFHDYSFARQIRQVEKQWHQIEVPEELYGKTLSSLADVRIVKIDAADTVEVPYVVKLPLLEQEKVTFDIINRSHDDQGYYYTFQLDQQETGKSVNEITLSFGLKNFDFQIALEGSHDQRHWFTIINEYRIISIKNDLTDYQFTTLRFPKAQYAYFRIFIPTSSDPQLKSAGMRKKSKSDQEYRWHTPAQMKAKENKSARQTVITAELDLELPVKTVQVEVVDTIDFYRPLKVQYLRDSFATEKGYQYRYQTLYSGTLSSLDSNRFDLKGEVIKKIRIIIDNYDDKPLKISGLKMKSEVKYLIVRFDGPGNYFMLYGNPRARKPVYDIANFRNNIPRDPDAIMVGTAVYLKKDTPKNQALFESQWWFWLILITVMGLIGWFAFKMLSSTPADSPKVL